MEFTGYFDGMGNFATIEEHNILPYKDAPKRQKGYILTLTAMYDNDFIYHVSVHETKIDAEKKLAMFSAGQFKRA